MKRACSNPFGVFWAALFWFQHVAARRWLGISATVGWVDGIMRSVAHWLVLLRFVDLGYGRRALLGGVVFRRREGSMRSSRRANLVRNRARSPCGGEDGVRLEGRGAGAYHGRAI